MIKPRRLVYGDTIGVVPPSSSSRDWEMEAGIKKLQEIGFNVKMSEHCQEKYTHGYLAANDEQRADDINRMLADTEISAIMCQRGGYGAHRIVDKVNWQLLKENPRLFIGYSDATILHLAIAKQCGMVSLLGPMPASDFAKGIDDFSVESFKKIAMSTEPVGVLAHPENEPIETIVNGIAEGELVGGNLSLLAGAVGTAFDFDTSGKILIIEDIGEEPYRVDRMLSQLRLAGKFDDVAGIILGDFNNCEAEGTKAMKLREVFDEVIKPFKKPTILNFQNGHCKPMVTLPHGAYVRLDAESRTVAVLESAVS